MQVSSIKNSPGSHIFQSYNSAVNVERPAMLVDRCGQTLSLYFISPTYSATDCLLKQSVGPGFLLDRYI